MDEQPSKERALIPTANRSAAGRQPAVRAAVTAALALYLAEERQDRGRGDRWAAAALPHDRGAARPWRTMAWAEAERPW
ncbi:MAG TPA: hypothetical protein VHB98_13385 [Chloroflexota bacterium]|nr:hypothetical protein [Chloroflexota bacterium]